MRPLILIIAVVLMSASVLHPFLSFTIFPGVSLLFGFYILNKNLKGADVATFLKLAMALVLTFLFWSWHYHDTSGMGWLLPVIQGMSLMLSFAIYTFTDRYAKNRLGLVTVAIFWLAIEFILYEFLPQSSRFMLASAFNHTTDIVEWNVYTGYMGGSLWILLSSIAITNAFAGSKIYWGALILAVLIIAVPLFINLETSAIIQHDLVIGHDKQLSGDGEYVGKTAAWVSILILLYSFVKREVN